MCVAAEMLCKGQYPWYSSAARAKNCPALQQFSPGPQVGYQYLTFPLCSVAQIRTIIVRLCDRLRYDGNAKDANILEMRKHPI